MSPVDKDVFVKKILALAGEKWIMDGNHSPDDALTKHRFIKSDLIVFLDFEEQICIEGIKGRIGRKRPDVPDFLVETEEGVGWLYAHVKRWHADKKPELILSQAQKYNATEKLVILKNRQEVDDFLNKSIYAAKRI